VRNLVSAPAFRRRGHVMVKQALSVAPNLIFDEIGGAIEAGIRFVRPRVRLHRRA
jgi:hypothetical protein